MSIKFNTLDFKTTVKKELQPTFVDVSGDSMIGNLDVPSLSVNGIDLSALITSLSTPTGTIISSISPIAPVGYLEMTGQLFNISDYSNLYNLIIGNGWTSLYNSGSGVPIGKFFIPDLRGAFLRGAGTNSYYQWSNNQGNSIGGFQLDGIKAHSHNYTASTGTQSVSSGTGNARDNSSQTWKSSTELYYVESQSTNSGQLETRVFNMSICWYIKY